MTATVTSLESRRRNQPPTCGCARHRLEALTEGAVTSLAGTEGQLLVGRDLLEFMVDDLVSTVAAALEANAQRTNP